MAERGFGALERPEPSASPRPARLSPSGPGNISGKSVSTVGGRSWPLFFLTLSIRPAGGSMTTRWPAKSTLRHDRAGEGEEESTSLAGGRHFEKVVGAVIRDAETFPSA